MSAMNIDELAETTRRRLASRNRRVVAPGSLVPAAVLVLIIDRDEPYLVFAKRTERVGHHKGQISFPGGIMGGADASLLDTALRECEEEIGLPPTAVEPLGALDDTETVATQFVITPFVARVREAVAWQPDGEEIEKVIEVPWAALNARGAIRVKMWERDGVRRPVYFFDYQGETIWGATARILKQYLDLMAGPGEATP